MGGAPGRLGFRAVPRPIFRGVLSDPVSEATLSGSFGVGWIARVLCVLAGIEVFAYLLAWVTGRPLELHGISPVIPIAFVIAAVVTRINAIDDIPLIQKNLIYSLDGE